GVADESHHIGAVWHGERDGLLRVEQPAGAYGTVRVTFKVVDQHLLADARDGHRAPAAAGPRLRHADPAGTGRVVASLQVPGELHLDPPVLVGVDLLPGRTDHRRGLRPLHHRLGVYLHRAVRDLPADEGEGVAVEVPVALVEVVARVDLHAHHQ